MVKQIIFIGPLGGGHMATGGSEIKNQRLLNRLDELLSNVIAVDTSNRKRRLIVIFQVIWIVIRHPKSKYIISTSYKSAYKLIYLLCGILSMKDVFYWVIGGALAENIQRNHLSISLYKKVRCIIVEGKSMKTQLANVGITNVIYIPNFKRIDYIPEIPDDNTIVRFVFLSRITPFKGCNIIMDAVEMLNTGGFGNKFSVDFYGAVVPEYKTEFDTRIMEIHNANYCGFLDLRVADNYQVLAAYTAMLFPTYWPTEGFPGVIIDAFIAGVPVIASDWNMNGELIKHGVNGLLISPQDINALYEAMKNMIIGENDICKMKKRCQEQAQEFNIENVVTKKMLQYIGII